MKGIIITKDHLEGKGGKNKDESLGLILNKLRVKEGMYQADVAKEVGGYQYRISEIEHDFKAITLKTLLGFANAIGYDLVIVKKDKKPRLRRNDAKPD